MRLLAYSALFFAACAGAKQGAAVATHFQPVTTHVLVTGSMYGYYRLDCQAHDRQSPCLQEQADGRTKNFLDLLDARCHASGNSGCVLLGMGSNFAPVYEARFEDPVLVDQGHVAGKISEGCRRLSDPDGNGSVTLACPKSRNEQASWKTDNVGRFLQRAGYAALVPGKEDFYFGAYRLWQVANSLDKRYLADNLILTAVHPTPREERHDLKYSKSRDGWKTDFDGVALPWLAKITLTVSTPPEGISACLVKATQQPDGIAPPTVSCSTGQVWNVDSVNDTVSLTPPPSAPPLDAGFGYGLCLHWTAPPPPANNSHASLPFCIPIQVVTPFFSTSYVLTKDGSGTEIAVFGVVDGDFRSFLPANNAGWQTADPRNTTQPLKKDDCHGDVCTPHQVEIGVMPPDVALQQTLDRFALDHPDFQGVSILMAQMNKARAEELARHMRTALNRKPKGALAFDLTLARPSPGHPLSKGGVSVDNSFVDASIQPAGFVQSAPVSWETRKEQWSAPIAELAITRGAGIAELNIDPWFVDTPTPRQVCPSRTGEVLKSLGKEIVELTAPGTTVFGECVKSARNTAQDCDTNIGECVKAVALCAMMDYREDSLAKGADIALLQERDVFYPRDVDEDDFARFKNSCTVQEALDRFLWKGDLLARTVMSGKQVNSIIDKSDSLQKLETDPLYDPVDAKGQRARMEGIFRKTLPHATDKGAFSHLERTQDDWLYEVYTSNHIGSGDTGYTEFAKPAVSSDDTVFEDQRKGLTISGLACQALLNASHHQNDDVWACRGPLEQPEFLVGQRPFPLIVRDSRREEGWIRTQVSQLTSFWSDDSAYLNTNKSSYFEAERETQSYHFWDLNLQTLTLGGSWNFARDSIEHLKNLQGIQNTDFLAAGKGDLTASTDFRALYRWNRFDLGGEFLSSFERSYQGATVSGNAGSVTVPFNTLTIGPLMQFHLFSSRILPHWLVSVRPADWTTQIVPPYNLQLTDATGKAYDLALSRVQSLAPKVGLRREKSSDTFFEGGFTYQRTFGALDAIYDKSPNGSVNNVCELNQQESISDCIKSKTLSSQPLLYTPGRVQYGLYWNQSLSWILSTRAKLIMTSRFNWFPGGDKNTALTDFDGAMGAALSFPIVGNLSFQPKTEWRFFENQGSSDLLTRINTTFSLAWTFRRNSRVAPHRALSYKANQ